jgi:hypothetical protein
MPAGLTAATAADWAALEQPSGTGAGFHLDQLAGLPEPIGRWLIHAIAPGTPLLTSTEVRMHGRIRLGAWRPFTATQRLTPTAGFIWAACARLFGLPVTGFDRFTHDRGQMRWRLLNLVPVMAATGPDITRSAAGRHAGELLLYTPAGALCDNVTWAPVDDRRATGRLQLGRQRMEVTLSIDPSGALTALTMARWGNPIGQSFGEYQFGANCHGEATFGGITVPRQVTAGWHCGSSRWHDGQFIEYSIDDILNR